MKILILKRTAIVSLIAILVVVATLSLNNTVLNVSAVTNNRKLPIYSVGTNENKVAISFDAAWGADKTRDIMSICDEYNVKATFFLVGFWIEKYPDMVKEIYNNGFEIGIHSNTHPDMTKLSRSEIRQELETNMKLVYDLTNFTPKLFRPPFGYYNNNLIDICEELDLSCIEWSVDSLDWKGISASELAGRVTSRAKSGSIVLFHNNSDHIISGLKLVLEHFKNNKLQVVPIGELIYYDNFIIDVNGTQNRI